MNAVDDILVEAKRLAEKSKTWADLSNALFDPLDGLVARRIQDASERAAFRKTDAYDQLHSLVEQRMKQTGVVAGAEPKKSGRFVVRLPKTMHAALEQEASSLPKTSGLYLFSSSGQPVYLSQTDDLRHRIERHMDVSNSLGLPKWLWDQGPLDLSLAEMPGERRSSRQKVEILLAKKLHPILNFQRAA